ncbi:MAG: hypothetical protein KJZ93_06670 [Caldilineaceae bacterium]|nr:hypothetical protein [Caldilineaceae bacterium]
MGNRTWPDPLHTPSPARVEELLRDFWRILGQLPHLANRREHLLADHCTAALRSIVIEMMLALNGIARPSGTAHLNSYLSDSQRAALEKTLIAPVVAAETWIGRSVALVVIYRWYAPQLEARFGLAHPQALEDETLAHLQHELADWPLAITTDLA